MKVEANWGWMTIDGRRYDGDVVIHVDGAVTPRETALSLSYRKEMFHTPLSERELHFLSAERPEVVIVAAGHKGMLTLTPAAKEMLDAYATKVVLTPEAARLASVEGRRFVAIFHLTC
ncbi:MAG: hypothetical protein LUQ39_09435 [Methanomassiliicoccales archaeon]|nr:hypothetical protein [Methanomassiliicoccales archaeon]